MKSCTKCEINKDLSCFKSDKKSISGYSSWCKNCHINASKKSRQSKSAKEYDKSWKLNNVNKVVASNKRYLNLLDPLIKKTRAANRKRKFLYGISETEYYNLLQSQNSCCAICKRDSSLFKKKLDVDHCHKTLKIRGLLCSSCNRGIGLLQDSLEILRFASDYIEKSIG